MSSRWLPRAHDVEPDDPRADDGANYVGAGLLAFPLIALAIGFLFLPPGVSLALIRAGVAEGRILYLILGGLLGVAWLVYLRIIMVKLMGARERPGPGDEP
jgi:hypothetical protein